MDNRDLREIIDNVSFMSILYVRLIKFDSQQTGVPMSNTYLRQIELYEHFVPTFQELVSAYAETMKNSSYEDAGIDFIERN